MFRRAYDKPHLSHKRPKQWFAKGTRAMYTLLPDTNKIKMALHALASYAIVVT
jgi:hypothetical protein